MKKSDHTSRWSLFTAVGAAAAASACCTIPLVLVGLGLGGAWIGTLTALEPLRPLFIMLAAGTLGFAAYREWRRSRQPDCDCEAGLPVRMRRGALLFGFVAVFGLVASPWIVRQSTPADAAPVSAPEAMAQVVLTVEGMSCASCNVTVQKALTNLGGVKDARVTFEPPRAIVHYDPAKISIAEMMRATADVGYASKLNTAQ